MLAGIRQQFGSIPALRLIYGGSTGPGMVPDLHEASGLFLGRFAHDPRQLGFILDEAIACTKWPPQMDIVDSGGQASELPH